MKRLILFIFIVYISVNTGLVSAISTQPLTETETSHLAGNSVGFMDYDMNPGIDFIYVNLSKSKNGFCTTTYSITVFNTNDETVYRTVNVIPFSGKERTHDIKEKPDYMFYYLPDLDWVSVEKSSIKIPSNSKTTFEVTIILPIEEAKEKSKDGGFIYLVCAKSVENQLSLNFAKKAFIIFGSKEIMQPLVNPDIIYIVSGLFAILLVSLIIIKFKSNKKTNYNFDDDIF